jgi:hypothetical protein
VVGDIYLDGTLVAPQAASYDTWVAPSRSHRVEVKAITDPAAGDVYRWRDATTSTTLNPGQERSLVVRLQKQWLKGFLHVTCNITNPQPGMVCLLTLDGVARDPLAPGASADFTLDPGSHPLSATVGPAGSWTSTTRSTTVYITGGRTTNYTATLTAQTPPNGILLVNNSGLAICNVYISPTTDPYWEADWLAAGQSIAPGAQRTFSVAQGVWDMRADDCSGNIISIEWEIPVYGTYTWYVGGVSAAPPPAPTPSAPSAPASGTGTVTAVTQTGGTATCRITIAGMGGVWFLDAPASMSLPAGTYSWQAFLGPRGETGQFAFTLRAGASCVFTCYDEFATTSCPN